MTYELEAQGRGADGLRAIGALLWAIPIALAVVVLTFAQDSPAHSGKVESVLPQAVDLPGPMSSLNGNWSLAVEDGRPVLTMDLEWSAESADAVQVTLEIVAVVQTQTVYIAFLDIPLPETLAVGTSYEVRAEYEWDKFLRVDLSRANGTYMSADSARKAMDEGARISQIVITRAKFTHR